MCFSMQCKINLVGELVIGSQDIAFTPSRATFSTTFPKKCCRSESPVTTPCLNNVVGVSKGMLSIKYSNSNKTFFLCQSNFMEIIRLLQR